MKRPAFQFYPADWRKDAALQSCSLAAQGLWVNMLCIAHECDTYGHLTVNGKPMTAAQLGRLVGAAPKECERLLAELTDAGVPSVRDDGAVFSRRMVRDEDVRNRRAEGGSAGAEHGIKGAEHGSKGGRPRKPEAGSQNPPSDETTGDKKPPLEPPPSSSSSSSTSVEEQYPPASRVPPRAAKKCPESFAVTDELRRWAAAETPGIDVDAETAVLRDHTFATARNDWPGTWRNWMRKAAKDAAKAPRRPAGNGTSYAERMDAQAIGAGVLIGAIRRPVNPEPVETVDVPFRIAS